MFGKKKALGLLILTFVSGGVLSLILPVFIIALIEAALLLVVGWVFLTCR